MTISPDAKVFVDVILVVYDQVLTVSLHDWGLKTFGDSDLDYSCFAIQVDLFRDDGMENEYQCD